MLSNNFSKWWEEKITFDRFFSINGKTFRAIANRKTLRFEIKGKGFFIKLHFGVGWLEIFKNLFQCRIPVLGAKNEYLAIQRLTALSIDTMTLCAYGCRGWNPARIQSFVITEALDDTVSLEDYCRHWRTETPGPKLKRALIRRVAEVTKKLHENGINHRDLYICHFLLKKDWNWEAPFRLYLIDLHRVQIRKKTPARWKIKDVAALYFSSLEIGLTERDLLRFIKFYRGESLRSILTLEPWFWERVQKRTIALAGSSPDESG